MLIPGVLLQLTSVLLEVIQRKLRQLLFFHSLLPTPTPFFTHCLLLNGELSFHTSLKVSW